MKNSEGEVFLSQAVKYAGTLSLLLIGIVLVIVGIMGGHSDFIIPGGVVAALGVVATIVVAISGHEKFKNVR